MLACKPQKHSSPVSVMQQWWHRQTYISWAEVEEQQQAQDLHRLIQFIDFLLASYVQYVWALHTIKMQKKFI